MTLDSILNLLGIKNYWEEKKLKTGIRTKIDYKGHVKVYYPMDKFIKYSRTFTKI